MCNCNKCKQQQQPALVPELETILQESEYGINSEYEYENQYENEYEEEYEYEDTPTVAPRVAPVNTPASKQIWLRNTDLNAPCFAGNFNFLYNAGASEATVTFNTKITFKGRFSDPDKQALIARLKQAGDLWSKKAEIQVRDNAGNYSHRVTLNFQVKIVTDKKNMNKETEVFPAGTKASIFVGKNRELVNWDLNLFINTPLAVIAHELGHVWGLKDEYKDSGVMGWLAMKMSPCHVGKGSPFVNDVRSIMNEGGLVMSGEFRARYFLHFGRAILNAFWSDPRFVSPVVQNGRTVAKRIMGRVVLLKRDLADNPAYTTDRPHNPQFIGFQVAKR